MALPPAVFTLTPNTYDGLQRLSDPTGTLAPGTILDPVSNLTSGAVTSSTIAVSWSYSSSGHDGFEVERQVGGGAWVPEATLGDLARNHTLTGLPTETLVRVRVAAYALDGSVSEWSTVEATTSAAPDVPDGDVVYSPARIPLRIINPRPNSERLSRSRYSWTHSQVPYRVPICVGGGRPPFVFSISGAAGFSIVPKAPSWNPGMVSWAEVHAAAGVAGSYTVTVTDLDGEQRSVTVTVALNDNKFRFFDAAGGNDSNSGLWGSPRQTNQGWYGADKNSVSPMGVDNIMVFMDGDYVFPSSGETKIQMGKNKPMGFINMPGQDAVRWYSAGASSRHGFTNNEGGSGHHQRDWFFAGIEVDGLGEQGSLFKFNWSNDRMVWWQFHMHNVDFSKYTAGDVDNIGGIIMLGLEPSVNQSIVDGTFTTFFGGSRNNTCAMQWYHTGYVNVDGVTVLDFRAGSAAYVKRGNHSFTFTSLDEWTSNAAKRGPCAFDNAVPSAGTPPAGFNSDPTKNVLQMRYSRVFTASNDTDVFRTVDARDGFPGSSGWRDRSVMRGGIHPVGAAVGSSSPQVIAGISDCIHFSPFTPTINDGFTVIDTISVAATEANYAQYVDTSTGAALGDDRYKKSFLVPDTLTQGAAGDQKQKLERQGADL